MNKELRNQREALETELRQIVEHEGEISKEMAQRFEQIETEIEGVESKLRDADIRERFKAHETKPATRGFTPGNGRVETATADPLDTCRRNLLAGIRGEFRGAGDYDSTTMSNLIPTDLQNMMVSKLHDVSAVRNVATVMTFANDVEIPRTSALIDISSDLDGFTDEAAEYDAVDGTFDKVKFSSFKTAAESYLSEEFLSDGRSGGSIVQQILDQHAGAHGLRWEAAYTGTTAVGGTSAPDGLCADTLAGGNDTSAGSGDTAFSNVDLNDLIDVVHSIPAQYRDGRHEWIVSSGFAQAIAKLADGESRLFQYGQATGSSADSPFMPRLMGYPMHVSSQMPAEGANVVAAILLHPDSYVIADRTGFASQLDPFSKGSTGETVLRTRMRSDGRWLAPWKSARLKLAAS